LKYTTERLVLRPYETSDYESWISAHATRQAPQSRHDGGPYNRSEKLYEWFVQLVARHEELRQRDETHHYGVFDKGGRHIGHVDFHIVKRENYNWAWIGYYIHNQYQQQGFGVEAVTAAVKEIGFGTLGLKRVEAVINTDNVLSIKLAQQCGFEFEWTKKEFIFEFGEWTDNHIYVMLDKDKKTLGI
jgi:ribosomal-protein-alanine N-acetyltransferase